MRADRSVLVLLLAFLGSVPAPCARAERLTYVKVHLQNATGHAVSVQMTDERDGRTFVVRMAEGGSGEFILRSSEEADDCCGSVSYQKDSNSATQHSGNLKDGDYLQIR